MAAERLDPLIHQQTRLQVLAALYRNRRASFTDLRDGLDLTAGNLASHAGKLEAAGYVRSERVLTASGFESHYVITRAGSDAFTAYLAALSGVLDEVGVDLAGLPGKQATGTTPPDAS